MVPKGQMVNYLLPWMYKRSDKLSSIKWERDETIGFVQAPQFVIVNEKSESGETGVVGLSVQKAKDSFGLCQCNGTNMLINLSALTHVNGMPYDSFTEDNLFGLMVQEEGYRSVYVPIELSTGKLPDNPAAAVLQQIRWSKGQFQSLLLHTGIQKREPIRYRSDEDRLRCQQPKANSTRLAQIRKQHWQLQEMFTIHMSAHPVAAAAGVFYIIGTVLWTWADCPPLKASVLLSQPMILICLLTSLVCRVMSLKMACGNISLMETLEGMREHYAGCLSALLGIIDAFSEALRGKGMPWVSTGTVTNHWSSSLIYATVIIIMGGIATRLAALSLSGEVNALVENVSGVVMGLMCVFPLFQIFSMGFAEWSSYSKSLLRQAKRNFIKSLSSSSSSFQSSSITAASR
jgi:hypothetical protein